MATTRSTDLIDPRRVARMGRHIDMWGRPRLREFPWRTTRHPWSILVAEIMLQQTQAVRVVPKFEAFLEAFPSPQDCAAAPLSRVLELWVGLGYNRRARSLWLCAKALSERGDEFPDTVAGLMALPGVGPYTARAVLAFAFSQDVGVLDTNVARIVSRAVAGKPTTQRSGQSIADALVPQGCGWSFNQAILDLGATICTARQPLCHKCPLRRSCSWARIDFALPDPATTSFGTTRTQARFEGSDRQLRGTVVRTLAQGPATLEVLGRTYEVESERLGRIVDGLIGDGLVIRLGEGSLRLG